MVLYSKCTGLGAVRCLEGKSTCHLVWWLQLNLLICYGGRKTNSKLFPYLHMGSTAHEHTLNKFIYLQVLTLPFHLPVTYYILFPPIKCRGQTMTTEVLRMYRQYKDWHIVMATLTIYIKWLGSMLLQRLIHQVFGRWQNLWRQQSRGKSCALSHLHWKVRVCWLE